MILAAVATATASGCAGIENKSRVVKLDQTVRLYADSIRWGNFETAASLVRRRDGTTSVMTAAIPAGLRVTGYASNVLSVNEQGDEAKVVTSFSYYFTSTSSVRDISHTDLWWFDPTIERWFMDGRLPDFRR